ncbi:ribosomal-protein-alanine N-acetyltransferase [Methanoculleus sp. FWC-SCC1]|uniref:Ribosomal-protein-alanine N-acetyltransferase n=1 Tax=Methanoculleus frigidifontis TaxID=2584085 RepID=A0ABT8MD94_9EURY|nr:ribosomal protein S18-alanine N-acetyltransferase [Methanoculleus sp. FWC-SCC1]MDN7025924.1 ribosomal-protein-alanine N-acetyltransferase [Methanoculleus sp. FWC-SCC1]
MATPESTIHKAEPADIPEIADIERKAFPDPWNEETLVEALATYPGEFFVARNNGRIVGFVAGGLEDTGEEVYGHIMNLAVAPECRGRGVGARLVRRLEQQFALGGAAGVQLEVRVGNTGAQRFYHRMGYQEVFVVACYYANDEDAVVMMKWFRF